MGGLTRLLTRALTKKFVPMGKVWAVKLGEEYELDSGYLTFCTAASIKVFVGEKHLGMLFMHKGLEESQITRANLHKALAILDPRGPRFRLEIIDVRVPGGLFCSSYVAPSIKEIYQNQNPGKKALVEFDTTDALAHIIASTSFDTTQNKSDIKKMAIKDTSGLKVSVSSKGDIQAKPPEPSYWSMFTKYIGWSS